MDRHNIIFECQCAAVLVMKWRCPAVKNHHRSNWPDWGISGAPCHTSAHLPPLFHFMALYLESIKAVKSITCFSGLSVACAHCVAPRKMRQGSAAGDRSVNCLCSTQRRGLCSKWFWVVHEPKGLSTQQHFQHYTQKQCFIFLHENSGRLKRRTFVTIYIPECNLLHNSSIAEETSKIVCLKTMMSWQCFAHAIQE